MFFFLFYLCSCPHDTVCNMQRQSCDGDNFFVDWSTKISAKQIYKSDKDTGNLLPNVLCEDKLTTCNPLSTCCKLSDNSYACCPHVGGVCCKDLCCPFNTECGEKLGECVPKTFEKWILIKLRAKKIEDQVDKSMTNLSTCPPDSTSCKNANGDEVCCPYTNGTCCGPHGYWCDIILYYYHVFIRD